MAQRVKASLVTPASHIQVLGSSPGNSALPIQFATNGLRRQVKRTLVLGSRDQHARP